MKAALVVAGLVTLLLVPVGTEARGGHGHGYGRGGYGRGYGGYGRGYGYRGPRAFFYGSFGWPLYSYPYYPYAYPFPYAFPYPYYYGYGPYAYPYAGYPSEAPRENEPPPAAETRSDPLATSYGLVQLRGVPEGADVELDGRSWLVAEQLDQRWLALPRGEHRIVVRARGAEPVTRRVEIEAGKSHVVRFGPRADAPS